MAKPMKKSICSAYFGDSTELTYLRSRYYSSGTGRFLTRDTWMGDYNRPLSLNRWIYVEGNPVNLTDPSGLCAKGKCGPDYTDWFINQATDHYQYSIRIRALRWKMKQDAYYLYWTKMFDCGPLMPIPLIPPFLSQVATERPFKEIVTQWNFPHTNIAMGSTPLVNPAAVNSVIDALGVLEYALYGLAVDYSNVEYPQAPQCNTPGCSTFGSKGHQAITICDKCMDVSDLGNLMFGLGGAARGYTLSFSYGSATIFNGLNDRNVMTMLGGRPTRCDCGLGHWEYASL